ncbi:uncharacterized protein LOC122031559 [Zingiber officinale]|uniref:uncharacterized protein LOC122031559 n=1 Tax=Zingiber officinale TaxID=94328 RepID=UPI001C4D4407|nr:uncharacterized protein LOC122031559 [Zingiber officinale]
MAIKSQSLVDFVTEVQNPEPGATWKVYVDGSSTRQGSDIGILLISPQEGRMHLSVRLDYRATNNEAEYEALIAGLQAAWHWLLGAFEINNARLKLYAEEAFEKLKANFNEVCLQKLPQADNQATDELAKLVSSISPIVIQQPIEQFGIPRRLVSDNGRQFVGQHLREWCEGYGIQQHFTSVAYPQSNRQVEVANREILRILRVRLDHVGGSCVDELPGILWVDDLVWKKVTPIGDVSKLKAPWAEPFKIIKKLRSSAYYLEDEDGR